MKRWFSMVARFHRVFGHHCPDRPTLTEFPFDLRIKLILEEAFEFVQACGFRPADNPAGVVREGPPDWIAMIDALCDLLYVVLGTFVSMGVEPEPFFEEVHRSNMAKLWPDGATKENEYGKTQKPPGWTPPQIGRVLGEYVERRTGPTAWTSPPCPTCGEMTHVIDELLCRGRVDEGGAYAAWRCSRCGETHLTEDAVEG